MNVSHISDSVRKIPAVLKAAAWVCLLSLLLQALLLSAPISRAVAADIGDNVMSNGGFEQSENGNPLNWDALGGWGNSEIALAESAAHSGAAGVVIHTEQADNPWIATEVPVEAGASYEVSAWLKTAGVAGNGVGIKLEFYKGEERIHDNHLSQYDISQKLLTGDLTGDWQQISLQATMPEEATFVYVYLRLFGTGTVNYDDASFELLRHKPLIDLTTDQTFYYSDAEKGTVTASVYSPDGHPETKSIEARIYRESTSVTLATYSRSGAGEPLAFDFDPSLMVKEEPYKVEVSLLDSANEVLEKAEQTIYRIDRPTMMRADGTLMVDGEPFFPIVAYHVHQDDYPYVGESGVNTVQGGVTNKANALQTTLDAAEQNGLKVLVPLYYNLNVKENAALTEEFVTRFKDHPAVLAWMIMDEPISNGKTPEELQEAYRLIRSLDSVHPTYMVEALTTAYGTVSRATDILATDVYPLPYSPISLVGERTGMARQAAAEGKPVWNVLQAMYNPPNWTHLPTIGEVRNMAYQSLLNGLQGLAYYSFNEGTFILRDSALWPGLNDFKDELDVLGRLVTSADRIDQGQAPDSRWMLWRDEDGELYAAAVNTSAETRQVTVPLGATGYRAELIYGDSRSPAVGQTDELTITLGPEQALLYRITPFAAMAGQAADAAAEAAGLSEDSDWTSRLQSIGTELEDIRGGLEAPVPDIDAAVEDALGVLGDIGELKDWAGQLSDGEEKQDMLAALEQMEGIEPLAGSYIQSELSVAGSRLVGQGESNELDVALRNTGTAAVHNIAMTLEFPQPFAMGDASQTVAVLNGGQTETADYTFQIPASPVPAGSYRLKLKLDYTYNGTPVSTDTYIDSDYLNILSAEAIPAVISATNGGDYPFEMSVTNNLSRALQVSLAEGALPAGASMSLPGPLSLPANGQTTVQGTLHLPATVTDGVYDATVEAAVYGQIAQQIPIRIEVDKNRLANPGFEQASAQGTTPSGWLMRQGSWVQDIKHGGQYAVSLLADSANAWNVVNSTALIPVKPGSKYELRGWVRNDSTTGAVSIGLRQVKADGISTVNYTWKATESDSNWTYYELEVTPSTNAGFVQVYVMSDTHTNDTAWFDDLYVEEIETP